MLWRLCPSLHSWAGPGGPGPGRRKRVPISTFDGPPRNSVDENFAWFVAFSFKISSNRRCMPLRFPRIHKAKLPGKAGSFYSIVSGKVRYVLILVLWCCGPGGLGPSWSCSVHGP